MTPARNQSGDAPPGVVEVEVGSLRPGQRFRLWIDGQRNRYHDGTVVYEGECSTRVQLDGKRHVVRDFFDAQGKPQHIEQDYALPPENWATSCPVEYLPDASPESER